MHQAVFLRLRCGKHFGGQEVTAGLALANGAYHVGADHSGDQAEFHFAQAEAGFLGGEHDVAAGGQADGSTEGSTLHQADHRLGQVVKHVHQPRQFPRVVQVFLAAVVRHAAHPAQVRASGEVLALGAQDDNAGAVIGVYGFQRVDQLLDDDVVKGVAFVRAVQHHLGDAAAAAIE